LKSATTFSRISPASPGAMPHLREWLQGIDVYQNKTLPVHMMTLRFKGKKFCDLLDLLVEAVELAGTGCAPAIEINGMIFRSGDLGAIAALMPDVALSVTHQAIVDAVLTGRPKKPAGYRKAAAILAELVDEAAARAEV
jgi:hypothetical protein